MTSLLARRASLLVLATLLALGCAGSLAPAFDDRFVDNASARTATVVGRLPKPGTLPSGSTLVATTHGAKPELIAYDLARSRVRWRVPLRAQSRPELLGDLVLTTADQRLLAFDSATGAVKLSSPIGDCAYLGSARDGARIFYSCEQTAESSGALPRSRVTAIDARTGRGLWQLTARGELGRPAATAGLVLVPWQRQSLALLDARDGRELARLRSRDDVIDWVRADARGAFFGQHTLYRLGRHGYAGGREDAKHVSIRNDRLPGRPPIMESAFAPQPGSRSARGRIALYAEPQAIGEDEVRLAYDRYYLAFYRYLFAYDGSGELRWARMLGHDVIAGQAVSQGIAIASDDGGVLVLSKDNGAALREFAVGSELAAASIDASGLTPGEAGARAVSASLRRSLTEIALDTDNRLVPARAYAIVELAKLNEPEVTRDLLDIYSQSTTPPELARVLADALRARRSGLEHLVDALAARYDYLEQTRPAPLSVIVPALVEAHEARAVPRLVERMLDHETPLAVLPTVVHAVVELGGDGVLEPLLSFVRLYRADSSFAAQPEALLEAARGVLVHGGEQGPALLASVVQDGRASTALASGIAALASQPGQRSTQGRPGEAVVATAEARPALPEKLGQEAVNATFAEHIDELRACLIDELGRNPKLALLRIAFIAENDGSIHALSFAPNSPELVDCLYPKIAAYRFPRFRAGREVASYVVSVRSRPEEPAPTSANGEQERWWEWYAKRARAEPSTRGEPWWRSQQPLAPLAGPIEQPAEVSPAPAGGATSTAPSALPQAKSKSAAQATPTPSSRPAESESPAPPVPEDAWWVPATRSTR